MTSHLTQLITMWCMTEDITTVAAYCEANQIDDIPELWGWMAKNERRWARRKHQQYEGRWVVEQLRWLLARGKDDQAKELYLGNTFLCSVEWEWLIAE